MKTTHKGIRIPNDLIDQIMKRAKEESRTFSNMVIVMLEEAFGEKKRGSQ